MNDLTGETLLVLILGAVLLGAGSLSVLTVNRVNPGLRGLDWLSASFASGAFAAGLLLVRLPLVNLYLADCALLGSFFFLTVAASQLTPRKRAALWQGFLPLIVQMLVDAACHSALLPGRMRIVALGIVVAFQSGVTAWNLRPIAQGGLKTPSLFLVGLLLAFAGFNLVRSGLMFPAALAQVFGPRLSLLSLCLYLAVALGLAFGFFWITTAKLTVEAEYIASTDPLTRVYNRRHFLKWCEKELLRSQRSGSPFSLLMVDLDHFKRINDNFGHHRGDEVLCAAVERMQDSVRGIDVLCRWGGEEFAVLLPNAPSEATRIVAERIRENIVRMKISLGATPQAEEDTPRLTASIGAATYRDLDDDIAAMLLRADRALYRAKASGRNRVLLGA